MFGRSTKLATYDAALLAPAANPGLSVRVLRRSDVAPLLSLVPSLRSKKKRHAAALRWSSERRATGHNNRVTD